MTQLPWKFYTWEDVDRYCSLEKDCYREYFLDIDVYPSSLEVKYKFELRDRASAALKEMFRETYNRKTEEILLENGNSIHVNYNLGSEDEEQETNTHHRPLFFERVYSKSKAVQQQTTPLAVPVFAFHSYRSDDSNERAIRLFSKSYGYDGTYKKFLIVDASISSPITSFVGEHCRKISYIDILNMLLNVSGGGREYLLSSATDLFTSSDALSESVIISCFRYKEQLFDTRLPDCLFPYEPKRGFCIQEVLSQIALQLKLDAVLINLGSGISEYSSPFLFDERVTKFLIQSFNSQSGEKMLSDMIDYTPINKFLY